MYGLGNRGRDMCYQMSGTLSWANSSSQNHGAPDQGRGGGPRGPTNCPGMPGYHNIMSGNFTLRKVAAIAAETVR